MSSKRSVTLEPHSIGDLLQEVTRAYVTQGMPSGALHRVVLGLREAADRVTGEDRECIMSACVTLSNLTDSQRKYEEELYK